MNLLSYFSVSEKPEMVVKYNKLKGGIDLADTLLAYHSSERKTIRWYRKIADNLLLGTCIENSCLLWNMTKPTGTPLVHLKRFRELLVMDLLQLDESEIRITNPRSHFLENALGAEGK